jgi:hypothetical protein
MKAFAMEAEEASLRPERILELSERISAVAGAKIGEIAAVNRVAKMLSINASIVAARAGDSGKGFSILAEEFRKLSGEIDLVASSLESEVRADLGELNRVGGGVLGHLRGQRLADMALNAIEIIDRNLYERTCDVRWWATDSAVVSCAADPSDANRRHASRRLQVILDAYTVYLDLWICDADGQVIANGHPERYRTVQGLSVAHTPWFSKAMATPTGQDFIANDVDRIAELNGAPVATYAAAIRQGGAVDGAAIGVLGVHFDWRPQAQAVVAGVRFSQEEGARSRVMILDQNLRVLASSDAAGELQEIVTLDLSRGDMGSYRDGDSTVGYARTPGYETYAGLGWYGCIMQNAAQTGTAKP